ncbi:MAG: rod shape-determining protein MreC [Candidatus Tantalella remota]|nr:rod shape-determining protein MreC [Candidatus Tantalella remota]
MSPSKIFAGIGDYFHSKQKLLDENRLLKSNVGELTLEVGQLKELHKENRRLRALLRFEEKARFDAVSAEITARNPNDWIGSFIINKGTADGVGKGTAVCSAEGLLGKVVEADESSSSVMLITHPSFKAGGMLKHTRVHGIITGAGKGSCRMLYLPLDAEVTEGEVVISSGFSRSFPKGITIGKIESVGKSRTGLYQYAVVRPSANSFDQEEVLCLK